MKYLLFSDLHADTAAAQRLVALSSQVDVLIGAGDFGNVRRHVGHCIDVLRSVKLPAVLVPGNAESVEELEYACRDWPSAHVLHGTGVEIHGVQFWGVGGGIPVTPFGSWSYDFSETEATELLASCPVGGVLVTHSPPWRILDVSSRGSDLGSQAIRTIIEQRQPRLVVCGHIHACWGRSAKLGSTTVINAGPDGVIWEG